LKRIFLTDDPLPQVRFQALSVEAGLFRIQQVLRATHNPCFPPS
jgi:hypothetical protein